MAQWIGNRQAQYAAILSYLVFSCSSQMARGGEQSLQLEVFINGQATNLIGSFIRLDDGKISALPQEILDIGLQVDTEGSNGNAILLDDLGNLTYIYDDRLQTLSITVEDADRRAQSFDVAEDQQLGAADLTDAVSNPRTSDWGVVLNYDATATSGDVFSEAGPAPETTIFLNGRLFSDFGAFEQTATLGFGVSKEPELIRLDSVFKYSHPDSLTTYRAGDVLAGATVDWARPLRLGGVQARTDFELRPSFATTALQTLTGIASSPSTVDVYVNGTKVYSQTVAAGPFTLFNVPNMSGASLVEMVISGADGIQTRTNQSVFSSPQNLRPGLSQWSIEAGLPRLSYGSANDHYALSPVIAGTYRLGLTDWLTAEAHVEAGAGTLTGGVGSVFTLGQLGVGSSSISVSTSKQGLGAQLTGSLSAELGDVTISATALKTFGNYDDVLAATSRLGSALDLASLYQNNTPPIARMALALGTTPALFQGGNLSLGYTGTVDRDYDFTQSLSLAYSHPLPFGGTFTANAIHEFSDDGRTTLLAGLSVPLDGGISTSASVASSQGALSFGSEVSKSLGSEVGSLGWRVSDRGGADSYRAAEVNYRSGMGTALLSARQQSSGLSFAAGLRGSVSSMGGDVFFSEWIDDSFAVVKTGEPGIEVYRENQLIGLTQANGMLLVPQLGSYRDNLISIDPTDLPVDAELGSTKITLAPDALAGVVVDFSVKSTSDAALVTFADAKGIAIPVGATGLLSDGTEFFVGYDGQAFIEGLVPLNEASIDWGTGACSASFDFVSVPGSQVQIGPVICG